MDNITLDELVRKYLSHCKFEKNLDAKTIKAYRIDLTQFSEFTRGTGGAWNRETIQVRTPLPEITSTGGIEQSFR